MWVDHLQRAELVSGTGKIVFRFYARDLHLVLVRERMVSQFVFE